MNTTDQLIQQLAARAAPVRPIASPTIRTAAWMAAGSALVVATVLLLGVRPDITAAMRQPTVVADWVLSLLIAATASFAAFQVSVPGRSARVAWVCLPPLLAWLSLMGWKCNDAIRGAFAAPGDVWVGTGECAAAIALVGAPIALLTFLMIRFASVTRPRLAAALGALAATALAAFAVSLHHSGDTALMVLVWHGGAVLVLSALAALTGHRVFAWIGIVRQ
jgi:hypothetical protein